MGKHAFGLSVSFDLLHLFIILFWDIFLGCLGVPYAYKIEIQTLESLSIHTP